jgi:hypothetical protein
MTMKATIIKSEVKKDGAIILLENSGLTYKAIMDCDFRGNLCYMREHTKPGQKVSIQFAETANGDLLVNDIEFLLDKDAICAQLLSA